MSDYGVMTFIYMGDAEAFIGVQGEDGKVFDVTTLKSGESTRQYSPRGTVWVVETFDRIKSATGSSSPTLMGPGIDRPEPPKSPAKGSSSMTGGPDD